MNVNVNDILSNLRLQLTGVDKNFLNFVLESYYDFTAKRGNRVLGMGSRWLYNNYIQLEYPHLPYEDARRLLLQLEHQKLIVINLVDNPYRYPSKLLFIKPIQ